MSKKIKKLYKNKKKRYLRKIFGTNVRPRLSIFRSNKHIYAQIINDSIAKTLVAYSTMSAEFKDYVKFLTPDAASFLVGYKLAEKAKLHKIKEIVFDRELKPYKGRVKSLCEGARSNGLIF